MAIRALGVLLATCMALTSGAETKGKRPRLDVKGLPRMAFAPVTIFFTAELVGGDDLEEYYCPEIEWDWGDGGKSVIEGDCPPFEAGAKIERRYTGEHEYRVSGSYDIKATLRRSGRSFAAQTIRITVKPGLTEMTSPD